MDKEFTRSIQKITFLGAASFSVELAKELGIFEELRLSDQPLTSHQVADARNLKERYVREILGCLTSACLVKVSSNGGGESVYFLQQEAKDEMAQGALLDVSVMSALSSAYPSVKECCHINGPNGTGSNELQLKYMDERSGALSDDLIRLVLENVDGLQAKLEQGIRVLECGSGRGHLLSRLATRFPGSSFTASEACDDNVAEMKHRWQHLPNMHYETIDLCQRNQTRDSAGYSLAKKAKKYDWILAVDVMHDLPHPSVGMENIKKMMNEEDGLFTAVDKAGPGNHAATVGSVEAGYYFSCSLFFCVPQSKFQMEDSEAHGAMWGVNTAVTMLDQAGFKVRVASLGKFDAIYICRSK